jgi:hypothetical protein
MPLPSGTSLSIQPIRDLLTTAPTITYVKPAPVSSTTDLMSTAPTISYR